METYEIPLSDADKDNDKGDAEVDFVSKSIYSHWHRSKRKPQVQC